MATHFKQLLTLFKSGENTNLLKTGGAGYDRLKSLKVTSKRPKEVLAQDRRSWV